MFPSTYIVPKWIQRQYYTLAQLSQYTSRHQALIAISGRVLNVTQLISDAGDHPGVRVILRSLGSDATSLFEPGPDGTLIPRPAPVPIYAPAQGPYAGWWKNPDLQCGTMTSFVRTFRLRLREQVHELQLASELTVGDLVTELALTVPDAFMLEYRHAGQVLALEQPLSEAVPVAGAESDFVATIDVVSPIFTLQLL